MRKYTPRRAGKQWLKGAPAYILDCFDDKHETDRYTVLLVGDWMTTDGTFAGTWVAYLGMDEGGRGYSGELRAYEAAQYRYRNHHRRVRWMDLPQPVRQHVISRTEED